MRPPSVSARFDPALTERIREGVRLERRSLSGGLRVFVEAGLPATSAHPPTVLDAVDPVEVERLADLVRELKDAR
jgi:hypothetical protein